MCAQAQLAADEKLSLVSRAGEAAARAGDLERQLQEARARLAQLQRDKERDVGIPPSPCTPPRLALFATIYVKAVARSICVFQEAEWKQFQSDLLMTVRVANDFKTEAQRELERLVQENKAARDRVRALEDQLQARPGEPAPPTHSMTSRRT